MTLNLKKKVTLTASQMLAENNRATADRLTWAAQTDEANLRTALNVPENGLTEEMAEEARDRYGRNVLPTSQRTPLYKRLAAAFINPFTVVLVLLAIFSALTNVAMVDPGDESWATVIIITIMVLISGILRFVQETRSGNVAAKLSEMIHTTVCVTREGEKQEIPLEEIVVGDIVSLSAGDMLPADVRISPREGPVPQPIQPDGRERAGGEVRRGLPDGRQPDRMRQSGVHGQHGRQRQRNGGRPRRRA